jgi:hypothetical protein
MIDSLPINEITIDLVKSFAAVDERFDEVKLQHELTTAIDVMDNNVSMTCFNCHFERGTSLQRQPYDIARLTG